MYSDIANIIKNIRCKTIMDIGCMKGQLLEQLDNLGYYCGIEISEEFGIITQELSKNKDFPCEIFLW